MRFLLAVLILGASLGCEKKPTEQEIAEEKAIAAARMTPRATPAKPADWMWKKYQNPLEKKPAESTPRR
jgi:hypothetical protein